MGTTTIRIPGEKRDMKEIITDLIDEYVERRKETLEILSKPEWLEAIEQGKAEVAKGVKGKFLHDLEAGCPSRLSL